jgi:hypothetical protein
LSADVVLRFADDSASLLTLKTQKIMFRGMSQVAGKLRASATYGHGKRLFRLRCRQVGHNLIEDGLSRLIKAEGQDRIE